MLNVEDRSYGIIPLKKEGRGWSVFLIQHKRGNHWGFPKGHGHAGETPQQTAERELKEETNLDLVEFLKQEPIQEEYRFRRQDALVTKRVSYFPALVAGEPILQEEEIHSGKWVPLAEATAQLTFKEGKEVCRQLIERLDICSDG